MQSCHGAGLQPSMYRPKSQQRSTILGFFLLAFRSSTGLETTEAGCSSEEARRAIEGLAAAGIADPRLKASTATAAIVQILDTVHSGISDVEFPRLVAQPPQRFIPRSSADTDPGRLGGRGLRSRSVSY